MADAENQVSLINGTILKVTPIDGNPNAVGVITGTQEPFQKIFRNGISVLDGPGGAAAGTADINCDLEVSGSLVVENDIRLSNVYIYNGTSAGAVTLDESDFGKAPVLLIGPAGGETVTIELPSPTSTSNKGRYFIIKKTTSTGTLTIDPTGLNQIDGAASVSATAQWSYLQTISTGNATYDYVITANNGFS
jgi:hypothetical protein